MYGVDGLWAQCLYFRVYKPLRFRTFWISGVWASNLGVQGYGVAVAGDYGRTPRTSSGETLLIISIPMPMGPFQGTPVTSILLNTTVLDVRLEKCP